MNRSRNPSISPPVSGSRSGTTHRPYGVTPSKRILPTSNAGEEMKAKALEVAMNYYLADLANKERVVDDLPANLAENLSTLWSLIEHEIRVKRSERD